MFLVKDINMKLRVLYILSILLLSCKMSLAATLGGNGAATQSVSPYIYTPLGCTAWQSVTTGSAILLSAVTIPTGATVVDLVPTVAIVLRDDGSAPTATGPGILIQPYTIYPYSGKLSAAQFISQSSSGSVAACFYR